MLESSQSDTDFSPPPQSDEELTQIFNSALISSRVHPPSASSVEPNILSLLHSSAFKELLLAMRRLSVRERTTLLESAEMLVGTLRKMDHFWGTYLLKEGFEKIKSQLKN